MSLLNKKECLAMSMILILLFLVYPIPYSSDKNPNSENRNHQTESSPSSSSSSSSPGDKSKCQFDHSMVNMEVGVASGFQFDKWEKNVTEMGRLSDIEGRYGWFLPKHLKKEFPYLQSWKVLQLHGDR